MNITYTILRISTATVVGHAHADQRKAEEEARELSSHTCEVHAVIENLVWENGHSAGTMSIIGTTGTLLRVA